MKQKSIVSRAGSYARGKRHAGGMQGVGDAASLAQGWEAGYRAALRDVSQVGAGLSMEISRELGNALTGVVTRATAAFKEELRKIGECATT